jgi:hypothetical protein
MMKIPALGHGWSIKLATFLFFYTTTLRETPFPYVYLLQCYAIVFSDVCRNNTKVFSNEVCKNSDQEISEGAFTYLKCSCIGTYAY